jgi:hypothetical protein
VKDKVKCTSTRTKFHVPIVGQHKELEGAMSKFVSKIVKKGIGYCVRNCPNESIR